ncbi:hypothetical protein FB45DRAFT_862338 [Roridomyces roridus]|uniref:Hydrophobin n=1 Tax=Roridomyces roridus TaxID=1738132 RepID=A0AAD7FSI8_9AGAR|nr:hypothetical protein FB45DRAFT_862338 [Roridomyces roridus]
MVPSDFLLNILLVLPGLFATPSWAVVPPTPALCCISGTVCGRGIANLPGHSIEDSRPVPVASLQPDIGCCCLAPNEAGCATICGDKINIFMGRGQTSTVGEING